MSDLINRADLIKAINDRSTHLLNEWDTMGVLMVIDEQPTIEERKRGEWIDNGLDSIGFMGIEYRLQKCSNCGETIAKAPMQRLPNFCSNCGADMRGEANERNN